MKDWITTILLLSLFLSPMAKVHQVKDPHLSKKIKDLPQVPTQQHLNKPPNQLTFKYFIFQQKCFDTFFTQHDFFNAHCIKLTLSKVIGYVLVYGSLGVKAPQILKIMMKRSMAGISFSSIIVETLMNSLLIGYNIHRGNPFSIYGENVFLGLSNMVMIACFFLFARDRKYATYIKGIVLLIGVSVPLIMQLAPTIVIQNSIWLSILAFLTSRIEQIRQNHKNKSTGNLSFLTSFMNFGGNVARTFTVLTETSGDTVFLISNILPIFVNGYILVQFFLYWTNTINYQSVSSHAKTKGEKIENFDLTKQNPKKDKKSPTKQL